MDNLSREISRLEQENTFLKSTIEKLIPEGTPDQTDGKAINLSKGITTEKQMKQFLHDNIQLKNKLLIYKLTTKKKQVLKLIYNGLSNKEIAKKLGCSYHTITTYRKSLLPKLKLYNTAALIQFAAQNGLNTHRVTASHPVSVKSNLTVKNLRNYRLIGYELFDRVKNSFNAR